MENIESVTFDENTTTNDGVAVTATWDSDYVVKVSANFESIIAGYTDNCDKALHEIDFRIGAAMHCIAEIEDNEYNEVDSHNRMHILAARAYIRDAIVMLIELYQGDPKKVYDNIDQLISLYNLVKYGPEVLFTNKMRSVFYSELFMPVVTGRTGDDSENFEDED